MPEYKRGSGENPPYIYKIKRDFNNPNTGQPNIKESEINPDISNTHFNSYFYNESNIPNRLITHYLWGKGGDYNLTSDEFYDLDFSFPVLEFSPEYKAAPISTTSGEFRVPGVLPVVDGTTNKATMVYNGTLTKAIGGFHFKGTMHVEDTYNFDFWNYKKRNFTGNILTFWGYISMPTGKPFSIKGPKIEIVQTSGMNHSDYPPLRGRKKRKRSAVNGGAKE